MTLSLRGCVEMPCVVEPVLTDVSELERRIIEAEGSITRDALAEVCEEMACYTLSYGVPVRERYGSTLIPATREQHDQNCTQSH